MTHTYIPEIIHNLITGRCDVCGAIRSGHITADECRLCSPVRPCSRHSCQSRFATRAEAGQPYWPQCEAAPGHDDFHRSGHVMDALWVWSDEQAMTEAQLREWKKR